MFEGIALFPSHPLAQVVTVIIGLNFLRAFVRVVRAGVHFRALKSGSARGQYIQQAEDSLKHVASLEAPDWQSALEPLRRRELAWVDDLRGSPNVLLLLGLLGTVLGLAGTVGGLSVSLGSALQTERFPDLARDLRSTIGHMQNAFSCTFWGILGAVIIGALLRHVRSCAISTLNELDGVILREKVRDILPPSQASVLDALREVLSESRDFLRDFQPALDKASDRLKTVLDEAGERMAGVVQRLQELTEATTTQLRTVAEELAHSASEVRQSTKELSHTSASTAKALQDSTKRLEEYHADLRNAHRELIEIFGQARQQLESHIEREIQIVEGLQKTFHSNTQDVISRTTKLSEDFQYAREAFQQTGDKIVAEGLNLHSAFASSIERQTEEIERLFKDHRFALDEVERALASIRDAIAGIDIADTGEKLKSAAEQLSKIVEPLAELNSKVEQIARSPILQGDISLNNGWKQLPDILQSLSQQITLFAEAMQSREKSVQTTGWGEAIASAPKGRPVPGEPTDLRPIGERNGPIATKADIESRLAQLQEAISRLEEAISQLARLNSSSQTDLLLQNLCEEVRALRQVMENRSILKRIGGLLRRGR